MNLVIANSGTGQKIRGCGWQKLHTSSVVLLCKTSFYYNELTAHKVSGHLVPIGLSRLHLNH